MGSLSSITDVNVASVEDEVNVFDEHAEYFRSFDRIIPGHVDFFPIGNDCKYFYSIVRSLTFSKGYCWATNKFLAQQANVSIRTVERWIRCLKDCELIQVEYFRIKNGYENRRKIWINEALISQKVAKNEVLLREIQKSLPTAKTCGPGSDETCGPGTTRNGGQLTKLKNKEESSSKGDPPVYNFEPPDPSPDAAAAAPSICSIELPKVVSDLPENERDLVIKLYHEKNAKKEIKDPLGWIASCVRGGWHLEERFVPPPEPAPESVANKRANLDYANHAIEKLECCQELITRLGSDFLTITHTQGGTYTVMLSDEPHLFQKRIYKILQNFKLSPELYLPNQSEAKKENKTPN